MSNPNAVPGKDGNKYIPFEERTGEKSVVFFTRDLSEAGLQKIYDRVSSVLEGKIAIKLHTGEAEGGLNMMLCLRCRLHSQEQFQFFWSQIFTMLVRGVEPFKRIQPP